MNKMKYPRKLIEGDSVVSEGVRFIIKRIEDQIYSVDRGFLNGVDDFDHSYISTKCVDTEGCIQNFHTDSQNLKIEYKPVWRVDGFTLPKIHWALNVDKEFLRSTSIYADRYILVKSEQDDFVCYLGSDLREKRLELFRFQNSVGKYVYNKALGEPFIETTINYFNKVLTNLDERRDDFILDAIKIYFCEPDNTENIFICLNEKNECCLVVGRDFNF